jgi:thioredoxin reductase (NADPH)
LDCVDETLVVETGVNTYRPRVVIIASGTKPRPFPLNIPSDVQNRVFSTIVPILNAQHKHIVIVGAGDAAFDYALNLSRQNKVTILNRNEEIQCLPLLWERTKACTAISYRAGITVEHIAASQAGNGLIVRCVSAGIESIILPDYLIFAIGRDPQVDFLSARLDNKMTMLTEGGQLFFIGDVKNGLLRQTAIAAGDGLRAAMQIYTTWRNR